MTRAGAVVSIMAMLSVLGLGCSSSSSPPPTGGSNGGTTSPTGGNAVGGQSGGGSSDQGGTKASGGTLASGGSSGGNTSGGSPEAGTGGHAGNGGATAGQSGSGGSGGTATGGATGGSTGGSTGGTAGSASGGAAGSGSGGTTGTDAVKSAGCGKAKTLQNGTLNITFGGASRKYILHVPSSYDNAHPYRLVFAFAESGSSAQSVADRNYFTMATLDTKSTTIFVAPDASNGAGMWSKSDVELTDAILAQLEDDLCIDKSRIFATGFSFGGAMSIAIACTRADVFRGVAFFSGADLTNSCPDTLTKPIAYYASQASGDSSGTPSPTSGKVKQAKFAEVNGCTPEPSALTFPAPGQPHTCTVYKNCSAGHPTVYCVFDGGHGWEPKDPGQSTSWDAPEAWKFITQF